MDSGERPIFPVLVTLPGQAPFVGALCSCQTARCLEPVASMDETVKLCVIPIAGNGQPVGVEFSQIMPIVQPSRSGQMLDGADANFLIC